MNALPKGWVEERLNEVCDLITDGTHHSPSNGAAGAYKYVTAKNIRKQGLDLTGITYVDAATHRAIYFRCPVKFRDVLYIKDGATTGIAIVNPLYEEFSMLSSVALLRPSKNLLDSHFLCYQLNSPSIKDRMIGDMTGSAIRRLTLTTIGKQVVNVPPLAEQKRIVAKLDALNAKSTRARTELARIETLAARYKQAVLGKAYSGKLTASDTAKWVHTTLGELAIDVRYGTAEKCTYAPELTPVLRIPNIANGRIDLSDLKHAEFNEKEIRKLALVEGDLLVIRSNGSIDLVGRSAVVDKAAAGMLFAGYLIRMRFDLTRANPTFIQFWMQSAEIRTTIEGGAKSTSGVNNVNSQQLQTLTLSLPPLAEQHEIVRRIESAFARIDRLAAEAKRALGLLGKLDEAILAKAFRGELVPQDETDEPASALLERIKRDRLAHPAAARKRTPRTQESVRAMTRTIVETLVQAANWLSAQELFERCGVRDGSTTEDVEKLYRQLLELERQGRVEIEAVVDSSTGAKRGDRIRLRK